MDLVKIDHIDRKAAKAIFDFATDRTGAQYFFHFTLGVPAETALREDIRPRARPALERAGDNFLGGSQSVDGRRIDPVDAKFERAVNRGNGIAVILRSPGVLPARTADGPGAIADGSDIQI